MQRTITVEVTFHGPTGGPSPESVAAEGVVRRRDGSERPFSGWIDLLAALEDVAAHAAGIAEVPR
jgi:hypothetical protein